jgi:three-Cys-motif partner protein
MGSPYRALSVEPEFSKVVGFEKQPRTAKTLEDKLRAAFPGRDVTVVPGDCNATAPSILQSMDPYWRRKPTFAMIDQYWAEIHWTTLQALAQHRLVSAPGRPRRKVELWLYFGDAFIPRALGSQKPDEAEAAALKVDAMYGTAEWRYLLQARRDKLLSGKGFKDELVNLMRWRLENDLGYETTIPLEFYNEHGGGLYTVIFATDHPVGAKIISHIFKSSKGALERMVRLRKARDVLEREAAASAQLGQDSLFDLTADEALGTPSKDTSDFELLGPPQPPFFYGYDEDIGH